MLSPDDIRRSALRRYADFLRSIVTGEPFFPLQIRFGKPSATEDFEKLRREIAALTSANLGCSIDWVEVNSRRWGQQRLPERIEFPDEARYLHLLGKAKEAARFRENLEQTRLRCPALAPLLATRPMDAVDFVDSWPGLLEVCCYFQAHPRPNLYARELPLSVDTKFVENHEAILTRLLATILPVDAMREADRFEYRFGLQFDEPRIRFRLLDEKLKADLGILFDDLSVPVSQFSALGWRGLNTIIVENIKTFLTLPAVSHAVGIWGAGNAAALLHDVPWLADCGMLYWGDLDVQGFEILAPLRAAFPKTRSVMMDEATLLQFKECCGPGVVTKTEPKPLLTATESATYARVRTSNRRLEQERIPHAFAVAAIQREFASVPIEGVADVTPAAK